MIRWTARALRALTVALVAVHALAWAVPLPDRLDETGSLVVLYADGSVAHTTLSTDDKWRIEVELDEVDPRYVSALIQLEDERFWHHPGVDPVAVVRALGQDLWHGEIVSGASTLTMQLARLLEPRPRTVRSKLVEMARAVQLEIRLSKREVLEAYLNHVPYGRNVEGVEAATLAYFGHRPAVLSPAEMAVLLAVPQQPTGRYPHPDHEPALRAARDRAAVRLVERGQLDRGTDDAPLDAEAVVAQIARAPVPTVLMALPREVPHVADWLGTRHTRSRRVHTTLDRGLQRLAAKALARRGEQATREGIHNGAVVIADHQTGRIEALVGSFDYYDPEHGGTIAAFDTPRSPGSTLKPFVYGRAIDAGLALPEHLVPDVPVRYGGYRPDNYDGSFSGMVQLETALARSLNVPFIVLLEQLGVEPFLGTLRHGGVHSLDQRPGHYGLSLVAGGIELTPLELTGLYAALANDGRARELTVHAGKPIPTGTEILTPESAWLVRRALSLRDRPDFPGRSHLATLPPTIHWKTGTSYGHRDAWAVGSGPTHTVTVWLGNLDNKGSTHLVGAQAAGPLLFDLLEALDVDGAMAASAPPELVPVEVCALSGHLPGRHCPHAKTALAPVDNVPTARCELHTELEVDLASGQRVTAACRAGKTTETRVAVVWPAEVRRWLTEHPVSTVPSLHPDCREAAPLQPPRIVAPAAGAVAVLVPGLPADDQELALQADAAGTRLSWFLNGEYLGKVDADDVVWWTPRPGRHTLVVQDESGASDRLEFEVRRPM